MNFWDDVYTGSFWYSPDALYVLARNLAGWTSPLAVKLADRAFLRWYLPTLAFYQ